MTDPRDMQAPTGFHSGRGLDADQLNPDPFVQFRAWLADAEAAGVPLPNAMALATATFEGTPSVRHVLLRAIDSGFVFNTNKDSVKGRALSENPKAALTFLWKELDRQVVVLGSVQDVSAEETDAYFASRPREAQIGAWASRQSEVISGREELEAQVAIFEARYPDVVPRPPQWGGYRVIPDSIEFWQGRRFRLHDRFRYSRRDQGWTIERLAP